VTVTSLIVLGAGFAGLAVVLGAFGAHGLEARLTERALETWQTGVQYQFLHAFALLAIAALWARLADGWGTTAAVAFVLGILLFSGSLYALALGAPRVLGAVAPVGGTLFIFGWIAFAVAALRSAG